MSHKLIDLHSIDHHDYQCCMISTFLYSELSKLVLLRHEVLDPNWDLGSRRYSGLGSTDFDGHKIKIKTKTLPGQRYFRWD